MRNFFLGVLLTAGLVSLVGAGSSTVVGATLSDLPLSQVFQYGQPLGSQKSLRVTMPPQAGLAITRMRPHYTGSGEVILVVKVNGLVVSRLRSSSGNSGREGVFSVNAPIIVPPGGTVEIMNIGTNGSVYVGGYFATRSQLGL